MQLLQLLGEQCNQQPVIIYLAAVSIAERAVLLRARGYLLCSCCNCWVNSALNSLFFSHAGARIEVNSNARGNVINTQRFTLVRANRILVPYLLCNFCNCGVSCAINN